MAKQLLFPEFKKITVKEFGGCRVKGHAREARPISMKRPMHLVLRSSLAKGQLSFLQAKRAKRIHQIVHHAAKAKGVKVYRYANSGNHLHLVVLPTSREAYIGFIRAISGLIARLTLGAERGSAKGRRFWDALPFTRILEWGKDYERACRYLRQNTLEALGFIPYQPRAKMTGKRAKPP